MNAIETAKLITTKVIFENVPFNVALRIVGRMKNVSKEVFKNASVLSGSFIRHGGIIKDNVYFVFPKISDEGCLDACLYLTNRVFAKKVPEDEFLIYFKKALDKEGLELTPDIEKRFEEISTDKTKLITGQYEKGSDEYLAYRFNAPRFLVKMWRKQYGDNITYKTLFANSRKEVKFFRVVGDKEAFLAREPDFVDTKFNNLVTTKEGLLYSESKAFEKGELFQESPVFQYIFDALDLDRFRKTVVYQEHANDFYLEIMARLGKEAKFDLIIGNASAYFRAKKNIEKFALANVDCFESSSENILACIPEKAHIFFVNPASSNYMMLREVPDFFIRCHQDQLDGIIANEKKALENCSEFVEEGGSLVYVVSTLNKKETTSLVRIFLNEHSDFTLEKERQFFSFDDTGSLMYYAILRRKSSDD